MTSDSGEPRTGSGRPLFGGGPSAAARGSVTMPGSTGRTDQRIGGSTVVPPDDTSAPKRPVTVGTAAANRTKGRRARLTVKRIDPWTTLKFSFVYSLAFLVVMLVAVVVLYGVVDALGVISSVRTFLGTVNESTTGGPGPAVWLGFGRVMVIAVIVGLIMVVLVTAFATLTAFIYNVCTDIIGGVEVTLAERQ